MTTPCPYRVSVFGIIACLLTFVFLIGCHSNKKTEPPKLVSFDLVAKGKQLIVTQEFEVQNQAVPIARFEPSSKTKFILIMQFFTQGFHKLESGKLKVKFVDAYEIIPQQGSCELTFQQYFVGKSKPSKSFVMLPTGEIRAKEDAVR
ncbi:MAG: hypothetical protein LBH01_05025 [Verrucomicrobiales bacterium]|nr:hypothetical protein [Verrucomicrobiales bacterium]